MPYRIVDMEKLAPQGPLKEEVAAPTNVPCPQCGGPNCGGTDGVLLLLNSLAPALSLNNEEYADWEPWQLQSISLVWRQDSAPRPSFTDAPLSDPVIELNHWARKHMSRLYHHTVATPEEKQSIFPGWQVWVLTPDACADVDGHDFRMRYSHDIHPRCLTIQRANENRRRQTLVYTWPYNVVVHVPVSLISTWIYFLRALTVIMTLAVMLRLCLRFLSEGDI